MDPYCSVQDHRPVQIHSWVGQDNVCAPDKIPIYPRRVQSKADRSHRDIGTVAVQRPWLLRGVGAAELFC